ncbi:nucleotide pyrophosphatase [Vulcanimicrobium alpinum]|uniref:Nucleotide pyrophosphatase n=1 Tax=Vulcanimicrobium alpinum TaxID=3016050 RepID=A0AAN1XS05_UNVUL|nr:alkaline phosphatase family protein [Vulcanimicrobium alpinum]BDE04862.1 nucleotide pyrophosphatase [Vulcanimicrobium alpinum]
MPNVLRLVSFVAFAALIASSSLAAPQAPAAAQSAPKPAPPAHAAPHNVILFVPDGLRDAIVDPTTAPAMDALRKAGVTFANPHSIFPTFTTANASSMATGHLLGDTGDFSNTIFTGYKVTVAGYSFTPFLENDPVIADVDEHFGGNYLDEMTILQAAHDRGIQTAAIGKLGPVAIFDAADTKGERTIVVDDSTNRVDAGGKPVGRPLPADIAQALQAASGAAQAPTRGANGSSGDAMTPGTTVANVEQQNYFVTAATKVVLPRFKAAGKPFVMVFWSRDPDGTQHNQGDSLGTFTPGINGPTSLAAIKNADDDLRALRTAVHDLGLDATTDIIVSSDHGFSTISKESSTSPSAKFALTGVPAGSLAPGFLALDLAATLGMPVSDPDNGDAVVHPDLEKKYPSRGNGLIGFDSTKPDVVVAANGGSDLIYLPNDKARELAAKIVPFLLAQDYVSGLFADGRLGTLPGTLPLASIALSGTAITPHPAIAVSFRSFASGCAVPVRCTVEVADTNLQQGQGMHGSFSRADTANFTAAVGPDFKRGFVDPAPVSNADVGITIAKILGLTLAAKGTLIGRAFTEAMPGGTVPAFTRGTERSQTPGAGGVITVLRYQRVGTERYFDAAGIPGRTVGL